MDLLTMMRAAAKIVGYLEQHELSIEEVFDEDEILKCVSEVRKNTITPKMSPRMNDFTTQNHLWLFVKRDGVAVAGLAARFDDIGAEHITRYWQRTYRRYYDDDEPFEFISPEVLEFLSGRLVYFGEMHVSTDVQNLIQMTPHVALLSQIMAIMKFQPNWLYAFVHDRQAKTGLIARYGFSRQIRSIREWQSVPDGRQQNEWLCAISAAEVIHNAKVLVRANKKREVQHNPTTLAASG